MRHILVFACLALAIGGGLAHYADRLRPGQPAPSVMMASTTPKTEPAPAASGTVVIPRDARGHFQVDGRVDGRRIGFMVDTGASVIALTQSDASRLGINPPKRDFTAQVKTANGTVRAAPVQLNAVEVGGLTVRNVQALVAPDDALSENLLGLSFLTRLKRFEYSNGKLVLEQ